MIGRWPTRSTQLVKDQIKSKKFLNTGSAKRIDFAPGFAATIEDKTQYGIVSCDLEVIEPNSYHIKNNHFLGHGHTQGRIFTLDFKCMYPITVPYKPNFPFETPKILGTQIAVVVGNPNNYMDEFGRVQVRFQWDRHFKQNENQIYIRVMQPSATKNAGTHFKVYPGDEVLVDIFRGGSA